MSNRKRKSRRCGNISDNLNEWDIQLLIFGQILLTGFSSKLTTEEMQRTAYQQNKDYLLGMIGSEFVEYGRRFWAFYRFECDQDLSHLYHEFHNRWMDDDRRSEFEWLEKNGYLLPGEKEAYEAQEAEYRKWSNYFKMPNKKSNVIKFEKKSIIGDTKNE